MKKNKKNFSSRLSRKTPFLCLGVLFSFALSACGSEDVEEIEYVLLADEGLKNSGKEDYDFSLLASYYEQNKSDYPNLEKAVNDGSINNINLSDLSSYRLHYESNAILDEIEDLMINFYFDYNTGLTNPDSGKTEDVLLEYSRYYNNGAFEYPTIDSSSRGPYESTQKIIYFRNDYLDLKILENGEISYLDSSFKSNNGLSDEDKQIVYYNDIGSSFIEDPETKEMVSSARILDANFWGPSYTGLLEGSESFSIISTRVRGEENYDGETQTFTEEFDDYHELYQGLKIYVEEDDKTFDTIEEFEEYILDHDVTKFSFITNEGKNVNYVYAEENGTVVDSKISFQAGDLLVGFIRFLYTDVDLRETGKWLGTEDIGLPAFTSDEIELLESEFGKKGYDEIENTNAYLFDLYGLDLVNTINSNLDLDDFSICDENAFTLVFDDPISQTTLNLFLDNSLFSPVPSDLLGDNFDKPGHYFRVVDYGLNDNAEQTIDYGSYYYSLSPYIIVSYGRSNNDENVYKVNEYYVDSDFTSSNNKINKITFIISSASDFESNQIARKDAFEDATKTYEYILDLSVIEKEEYLSDNKYFKFFKSSNVVSYYNGIMWNPFIVEDGFYNSLGLEMMFGDGNNSIEKVQSEPSALDNYYNGNGSVLRQSFYAAINWYTVAKEYYFPGEYITFYPWVTATGNNEYSFSNPENYEYSVEGTFFESDIKTLVDEETYVSYYQDYGDDYLEQLAIKSTYDTTFTEELSSLLIHQAAKSLDDLAREVGATKDNKALIPIFEYNFSDSVTATDVEKVNKEILNILNSLSPCVEFYYPYENNPLTWSDFLVSAFGGESYDIWISFYTDYEGVGSVLQQMGCSYGNFANFYIVKSALLG